MPPSLRNSITRDGQNNGVRPQAHLRLRRRCRRDRPRGTRYARNEEKPVLYEGGIRDTICTRERSLVVKYVQCQRRRDIVPWRLR